LHVPFFPEISSTFSGGDAAQTMAALYGDEDQTNFQANSGIPLTKKPSQRFWGYKVSFPGPGEVRPLVFCTDTTIGLKAAWSGATGQFPDTVKLGLNRKEFALAPLVYVSSATNAAGECVPTNIIRMPSFLATMDNSTYAGSISNVGMTHLQYFAAGAAAEKLAQRKMVRQAMLYRTDPGAAVKAAQFDTSLKVYQLKAGIWNADTVNQKSAIADAFQSATDKQPLLKASTDATGHSWTDEKDILRHATPMEIDKIYQSFKAQALIQ